MDQDNAITVIEKLADISKDGEKGYRDAAEHAKRSDLKAFFITQSSERKRFADELQTVLAKLGKVERKESGTVAGALHRAWIDTKVGLGAGERAFWNPSKGRGRSQRCLQKGGSVLRCHPKQPRSSADRPEVFRPLTTR